MSNKEFLTEFIEVYRQHTDLWKVKSSEYVNKNLKKLGICALLEVCKKYRVTGGEDMVKKKIQSLRSTFRKELKKVKRSMRSGRGSDDIYLPNLWYFDLLMFIKDQEQPTSSISNIRSPSSVLTEDISNDHNDSEDNNSDGEREKDAESQDPESQESTNMHESLDQCLDSLVKKT